MQNNIPAYLTEIQVADMTGIALSTLRNNRFNRTGIPYVKLSKSIRYALDDVIQHFESRKIRTDEYHKIGGKNVEE